MALLADRQQAFAAGLLDPTLAVPADLVGPDGEPSARRFAVYRNNVVTGLSEALRAGFPCVARLVGEEFFRAMACVFVTMEPPVSPILLYYGAGFPNFIRSFGPAASMPYLADVARIERAATEAYHAREEVPLLPSALAAVPYEKSPLLRLKLHPSLRMLRSEFPAFTIWRMNAAGGTPGPVDLSDSQDAMVLRPDAEVDVRRVATGGYELLIALGNGLTLSQATASAVAANAHFDLSKNLQDLLRMGAFAGFDLSDKEDNDE